MRHVIAHVLENGAQATKVSTACLWVAVVPDPSAAPGDQIEDDQGKGWCRKCLAAVQGREADQGLHPDVGVTEEDGEMGELEDDGELGDLEVENDFEEEDQPR